MNTSWSNLTVLPWRDTQEWKTVYANIYNKNTTVERQKKALERIKLWQKRMVLLPSGVEGTLCILDGLTIDSNQLSDREYRLLCCTSIMRFLNICVANTAGFGEFTKRAKQCNIPDWIISIRHRFAHSQKLTSKHALQLALAWCLNWLEENYWLHESIALRGHKIKRIIPFRKLLDYTSVYCVLFVYGCLKKKRDDYLTYKIRDINVKFDGDENPSDNANYLMTQIKKSIHQVTEAEWNALIEEILFTKFYIIKPSILYDEYEPAKKYHPIITNLFKLLAGFKKLHLLALELHNIVLADTDYQENASLWLNEIFRNISKEYCADIVGLQDEFVRNQNKFTKNFIRSFMKLNKPRITEKECDALLKVPPQADVDLFEEFKEDFEMDVDDGLCETIKVGPKKKPSNKRKSKEMDDDGLCEAVKINSTNKRWTKMADTSVFARCPLGVLPHDLLQ